MRFKGVNQCEACGEPVLNARYCGECNDEIKHGIIRSPKPLTNHQQNVLAFIRDFFDYHHRPPTWDEVGAAFHVNRVNRGMIENFRERGLLTSKDTLSPLDTPAAEVVRAAVALRECPTEERQDALTEAVSLYQHRQDLFQARFVQQVIGVK